MVVITLLVALVVLTYVAYIQSQHIKRDIPTLLNHYYRLKELKPQQAKNALDIIIHQEPENKLAYREMANWYANHGHRQHALAFLQTAHRRFPHDPQFTVQLAKLYQSMGQARKASALLNEMNQSPEFNPNKKTTFYQKSFSVTQTKPDMQVSFISPINISKYSANPLYPLYLKAQENNRTNPKIAQQALEQILAMNANEYRALLELGYLALNSGHKKAATSYLVKAFSVQPESRVALQLGYLFVKQKQINSGTKYFKYALDKGNEQEKKQARSALYYLERLQSASLAGSETNQLSHKDKLLNIFYQQRQKNPTKAWQAIKTLLKQFPNDIRLWKEAGYYAITHHQTKQALTYWLHVYQLEANPEYALQLGYLYDGLHQKSLAFHYFLMASKTTDDALKLKAELAMTNIGSDHTKILPDPFFVEGYIAPFHFSRFNLGVLPTIVRAGIHLHQKRELDFYLNYRRTVDSRSGFVQNLIIQNSISQIFEDNVAVYSLGLRVRVLKEQPLIAFIEAGRAQDLVYRNRPFWRGDLRSGLVYYNQWGALPTYRPTFQVPFKPITTLYADTIYYSRYDKNVIATAWFRPGVRIAEFQSSSLDVYLANFLVIDKNHEFYNNVFSYGPGIVYQPSNRLNIKVRFEAHQAYYLSVNSPTPNPYGTKFFNKIVLLEGFIRF